MKVCYRLFLGDIGVVRIITVVIILVSYRAVLVETHSLTYFDLFLAQKVLLGQPLPFWGA